VATTRHESKSLMKHLIQENVARLDRFLAEQHPEIPRSQWDLWIKAGNIRVNGESVSKGGVKLRAGDVVDGEIPDLRRPAISFEAEAIDLPTLFEDEHLWIIDKPAGMVVHPGPGHSSGTIVNALLGRLRTAGHELSELNKDPEAESPESDEGDEVPNAPWPGLVHRLDRYTTGCIVLAKTREAQQAIQAQFKDRSVEKRYIALTRSSRKLPELGSLLINEPIARHKTDRLRMTIAAAGRESQTRVRVLALGASLALVECELLTGRTHQIRVHLQHLGSALVGDPLYGGPSRWQDAEKQPFAAPHPFLHAWKIAVNHPITGERIQVEAPLPQNFLELLPRLGMEWKA
jgi:23S rRNA pseudouridine1911/1915/1917 synthase